MMGHGTMGSGTTGHGKMAVRTDQPSVKAGITLFDVVNWS
jgi:hypothetical protein